MYMLTQESFFLVCSFSFSSQGCKRLPQWRKVYLLLALYREVTNLYREANANFHPKPEVHLYIKTVHTEVSAVLFEPFSCSVVWQSNTV